MRSFISIALIAVIASCADTDSPPQADALQPEESVVLAEIEAYYRDFSARDWEAFADHFWKGATMTTIWQPADADTLQVMMMTIPDFVAQAPEGPGSKPIFEERMTHAEVKVAGNLAQVWAHYEAKFGDENDLMEWTGIDAFTLMYYDDRWRITSLAYSSN